MSYACIGATETGARCRNEAVPGERCKDCTEKDQPRAPEPTHILLKFVLSERRAKEFAEAQVPRVEPKWAERRSAHYAEAYVHGQDPKAYATETYKGVDSGTAVFGRQGLSNVRIGNLWYELHGLGFYLQDIHLERNQKGNEILVMALAKGTEDRFPSVKANALVENDLVCFRWNFVHVWANPPKADASVVHTMNCAGMDSAQKAYNFLKFEKGLWDVSTHSPAAA